MEGIDFSVIRDIPESQTENWFKGTEDPVTRDLLSGVTVEEMSRILKG